MPENEPRTGPEAIEAALAKISADSIEAEAKKDLATRKKTLRGNAIKKLRIVEGLRRNKIQPSDLLISKVPVVPTKYRPFAAQGDTLIPGDANVLYKDLFDIRNAHNEERKFFGDKHAGKSRLALYDAVKSCYGYGDAVKAKTRQKEITGFLQKIVGRTAKTSFFQQKMMAKTQDNVGRSTITVNPDYMLDEIGIPVELAYTMYAPYIQRRLKRMGFTDAEALKEVKEKSEMSRKALEEEIKVRPVLASRAPAWHSHSIIAQRPHLVEESAIVINPFITSGMNADFDGDDQKNKVYLWIKNEIFNLLDKKDLTPISPTYILSGVDTKQHTNMYSKTTVNTYEADGKFVLVDLENFPHGELSNEVEGKNGKIRFYHAMPGTKVVAYDSLTGNPVLADVTYWSEHPDREVTIVNLANGKQIFTDDDPRAVYGISMDSVGLIPDRFTPDAAVARKVVVPVQRRLDAADLDDTMKDKLSEIDCGLSSPMPLNFDTGWMIGSLAGDGWYDKKVYDSFSRGGKRFYIGDSSGHNASNMERIIKGLLGPEERLRVLVSAQRKSKYNNRHGDCDTYSFEIEGNTSFVDHLADWVGGARDEHTAGSGNKHLPGFMFLAPREFREGLLCGFMDTDGACGRNNFMVNERLEVQMTSTSLRLARELKWLMASLQVGATVTFSKDTDAGNTSWALIVSVVDLKSRTDVLNRLVMPHKRKAFQEIKVSLAPQHIKLNTVPFTYELERALAGVIIQPKVQETEEEKQMGSMYQTKYQALEKGTVTRNMARKMLAEVDKYDAENVRLVNSAIDAIDNGENPTFDEDVKHRIREGLKACAPAGGIATRDEIKVRTKLENRLKQPFSDHKAVSKKILDDIRAYFVNVGPYSLRKKKSVLDTWDRMFVQDNGMYWTLVESADRTGIKETGYDLTVPGYETFMNTDGTILSNTVNIHVPASDRAVKEAMEKLMPSQTPYSDRDGESIVPLPKQEQILGLHTAATAAPTPVRQFGSRDEALKAIRRGEVKLSEDISYPGMEEDEGV